MLVLLGGYCLVHLLGSMQAWVRLGFHVVIISLYFPEVAAVVSPVAGNADHFEDGNLSTGEEGNGFGVRARVSRHANSNNYGDTAIDMHNAAVSLKIHDGPEDAEYQLHRKSASVVGTVGGTATSALGRLGLGHLLDAGRASNQEQDSFGGQQAAQKYTVLGQKHQWRKNRATRSRQQQTISPVEDDDRQLAQADSSAYIMTRDGFIPRSLSRSASSYHEDSSSVGHASHASLREDTRADSASIHSESTGRESDFSEGRPSSSQRSSSDSTSVGEDGQRFVVTRQRKSKYSAKLHLPGQNPLYLGRYKNEEAALAACESAYSTITTPRK
ncbi:hypothetical protein BBJ28_00012365 [Nothophytophthora sp. Chile5]|nr:hypothetical protein BBJ28_00012365 [Nothophytophthora sp. Chile5]